MVATAIALKKINVTIQGLPPGLLMASKRIMEADAEAGKKKGARRSAEEEAELHCHWTKAGKGKSLAIPWVNLYKSICAAGSHFKWPGTRKMLSEAVAATVTCEVDMVSLGTDKYEVYAEWCRIPPRTGAMVKVSRPRIAQWEASLTLLVDDEQYNIKLLEGVVAHAGKMVGLGPWRPQLKGPYGRFVLTKFEIL